MEIKTFAGWTLNSSKVYVERLILIGLKDFGIDAAVGSLSHKRKKPFIILQQLIDIIPWKEILEMDIWI